MQMPVRCPTLILPWNSALRPIAGAATRPSPVRADVCRNWRRFMAGSPEPDADAGSDAIHMPALVGVPPDRFPARVATGLRLAHLANSSVPYEIGLFRNDDPLAAAQGHFVHVYVDRATSRPVSLPEPLRRVLTPLLVAAPDKKAP